MRALATLSVVAIALSLGSSTGAQTITYNDFSSTAGWTLNGSAAGVGSALRLTPSIINLNGAAWYGQRVPVALGFDATISFQISNPPNSGEGWAFCIHNDPAGTGYLGVGPGRTLGYASSPGGADGLGRSLVIELDSVQSPGYNDPPVDHISVHTNGAQPVSGFETQSIGRVFLSQSPFDGQVHNLRVTYAPATLDISLDGTLVLSVPFSFEGGGTWVSPPSQSSGPVPIVNGSAWVGFTAATGTNNSVAEHDILGFQMTSVQPDPCFAGNSASDTLFVDGSAGGFRRTVSVEIARPLTFDLQLPSAGLPTPFVIFGAVGFVTPASIFAAPFGSLCILPQPVLPFQGLFTLADSFGSPNAFFPAGPAPWMFTYMPGVPMPMNLTIQGVLLTPGAPEITNAVQINAFLPPAPTISSLSTTNPTPGSVVMITGSDFWPIGLQLFIDGVSVTPLSVTSTQIQFMMPPSLACNANLVIRNIDGQTASATLNAQALISGTGFSNGLAAGGSTFLIYGGPFASGTTVTVGGNPAAVSGGGGILVVTTPPGPAMTTVPVVVTAPGGCTGTTTYTYN